MVYGTEQKSGCELNKSINIEGLEGTSTNKLQAKTEILDLKNIGKSGSKNADIKVANQYGEELELSCRPSTSGIQKQYAVCVQNAYKSYGFKRDRVVVLDGLHMTVPKGVIYGMLGASGCGKTTLLNCIVGRKQLNSGQMWVLGGTPDSKGSGVPGPRIGYMPQENAVYDKFTIRETLLFFGWIAGMTTKKIQERLAFLMKLLMLPNVNEMTKNLSGGQQRRLSLAAALLHEPELLILDEPTVGLDPVVRENIWNHFLDITRDGQTTVIITTHYIDETRRAHCIALMRDGHFLAEDSPGKLLDQYGAITLEELFLKLCYFQDYGNDRYPDTHQEVTGAMAEFSGTNLGGGSTIPLATDVTDVKVKAADLHPDGSNSNEENSLEGFSKRKTSKSSSFKQKSSTKRGNHIKALFWKNCLWIMRNAVYMLFILILPFLEASLICLTLGTDPVGLSVSVVNYETNNSAICDNKLICNDSQLSCHYLKYLKKRDIILIPYDSEEDARESVLKGKTYASIVVKNNYSAALHSRVQDWMDSKSWDIASSEIDVFRDVSSKFIANYLKAILYDTFKNFIQDYMKSCDIKSKWLTSVITFENPIYGSKVLNFTDFAIPGLLLMLVKKNHIHTRILEGEDLDYILALFLSTGSSLTSQWKQPMIADALVLRIVTHWGPHKVTTVTDLIEKSFACGIPKILQAKDTSIKSITVVTWYKVVAIVTCLFVLSSSVTAATVIGERSQGLFERLIVIGISKFEFLVSHLLCHFMIMVVQAAILLSCLFALFNMTMNGSLLLVVMLTLLAGLCAMCFGLCLSCICTTEATATYVIAGSSLQMIMLSGIIWPIEGLHSFLKPLAPVLSTAQATESMRSIIQKDWGFSEEVVYMGFVSLSIGTIIFVAISVLVLKFKKD